MNAPTATPAPDTIMSTLPRDVIEALRKLSKALGSAGTVEGRVDQCVEAVLIEMAAERLQANRGAERAIAIADQAMYELLLSEGVPYDSPATDATAFGLTDEDCHEVAALAEASTALREAFEWLRDRGYVALDSDEAGEFVRVLRRPSLLQDARA